MKTSKTRIFPPPYVEIDKGHGRIEKRSIQASNALNEYLEPLFPYVGQVFRITRITTDLKGNNFQKQVHYGITSLTATQADLKRLLSLSRNHWHIENKIHYVRDFTYDEDRSQVRTGSGPRVMASLRNAAISILRLWGYSNIAKAIRECSWNQALPLELIGV